MIVPFERGIICGLRIIGQSHRSCSGSVGDTNKLVTFIFDGGYFVIKWIFFLCVCPTVPNMICEIDAQSIIGNIF